MDRADTMLRMEGDNLSHLGNLLLGSFNLLHGIDGRLWQNGTVVMRNLPFTIFIRVHKRVSALDSRTICEGKLVNACKSSDKVIGCCEGLQDQGDQTLSTPKTRR